VYRRRNCTSACQEVFAYDRFRLAQYGFTGVTGATHGGDFIGIFDQAGLFDDVLAFDARKALRFEGILHD